MDTKEYTSNQINCFFNLLEKNDIDNIDFIKSLWKSVLTKETPSSVDDSPKEECSSADNDICEMLSLLKLVELKDLCKENNIATRGTKTSLVGKLIDNKVDVTAFMERRSESPPSPIELNDATDYSTFTCDELRKVCSKLNITKNGTKQSLLERISKHLQSKDDNTVDGDDAIGDDAIGEDAIVNVVEESPKDVGNDVVNLSDEKQETMIQQQLPKSSSSLNTTTDMFGNIILSEYNLVLNDDDIVIGYLDEEDTIRELTNDNIKTCKSLNLKFVEKDNGDVCL